VENAGLTVFFLRLQGKLEEKRTTEQAEVQAARIKYDAALRELESVRAELEQAQRELAALRGCQARYETVFKEKQAAVGERGGQFSTMAADFLDALGGAGNIAEVTNCATRLRVSVKDESLVQDAAVFKTATGLTSRVSSTT